MPTERSSQLDLIADRGDLVEEGTRPRLRKKVDRKLDVSRGRTAGDRVAALRGVSIRSSQSNIDMLPGNEGNRGRRLSRKAFTRGVSVKISVMVAFCHRTGPAALATSVIRVALLEPGIAIVVVTVELQKPAVSVSVNCSALIHLADFQK